MDLELQGNLAAAQDLSFVLYYEDTNDPHKLVYSCEHCKANIVQGGCQGTIRTMLTQKELGSFPSDYKTSFPAEFEKIEERMKTLAR